MDKEEIPLLVQLLGAMREAVAHLEKSYSEKDLENFEKAKQEVTDLQSKIDDLL